MKEFEYNPKNGKLYKNGQEIGYTHRYSPTIAYRRVYYKGKDWRAHRLIWEMHYGKIPEGMFIDHINGNGLDNRLENLRLATQSQNACNRKQNKNNTSGYKGVVYSKPRGNHRPYKKPWVVHIQIGNKKYSKRGFATAEEAAQYYNKKAVEYFGEFAKLN